MDAAQYILVQSTFETVEIDTQHVATRSTSQEVDLAVEFNIKQRSTANAQTDFVFLSGWDSAGVVSNDTEVPICINDTVERLSLPPLMRQALKQCALACLSAAPRPMDNDNVETTQRSQAEFIIPGHLGSTSKNRLQGDISVYIKLRLITRPVQ